MQKSSSNTKASLHGVAHHITAAEIPQLDTQPRRNFIQNGLVRWLFSYKKSHEETNQASVLSPLESDWVTLATWDSSDSSGKCLKEADNEILRDWKGDREGKRAPQIDHQCKIRTKWNTLHHKSHRSWLNSRWSLKNKLLQQVKSNRATSCVALSRSKLPPRTSTNEYSTWAIEYKLYKESFHGICDSLTFHQFHSVFWESPKLRPFKALVCWQELPYFSSGKKDRFIRKLLLHKLKTGGIEQNR